NRSGPGGWTMTASGPNAGPPRGLTRREVLARLGSGFGGLALGSLLGKAKPLQAAEPGLAHYDLTPKPPHFAAKTRVVIQLLMHGGPSHVDLFDPKPMLDKYDGKSPPPEAADDEKLTGNLLKSPFAFRKHGQSGLEFAETLAHTAKHADDIAV